MLFLALGGDLLFVYLGWEGVGVCSYFLIGFWFKDPANGLAARKAFIVTRVGDTLLLIGLFLLFRECGTLDIASILAQVSTWPAGDGTATLIALLLLGGAVGKSAQLPLQTWLPDAMAGPTPVSALIHAATMVTAGVYLVARMHPLFEVSGVALEWVGAIGAVTLLLAGFAALVQTDIKRILAYSTMSQIGYMFLAEGAGAYQAAMFHLMTHAFFKALLFLSAGSVILALHHEQDIFRMGGLRSRMPFVFACMLIGTLALTAFPLTSGYFSKEEILHQALAGGHVGLYWAGVAGAFLTALYSFRLIFVVFFGAARGDAAAASHTPAGAPVSHHAPLALLLLLSLVGGFIHLPLAGALPAGAEAEGLGFLAQLPVVVSLVGIALAWVLFARAPQIPAGLAASPATAWIGRWWQAAWGFDWLYDRVFVRPFCWLAELNRNDVADRLTALVGVGADRLGALVAVTQNGRTRYYAAVAGLGVCVLIAVVAL
jgi:NADH-quinone oxidoreductase subunit L